MSLLLTVGIISLVLLHQELGHLTPSLECMKWVTSVNCKGRRRSVHPLKCVQTDTFRQGSESTDGGPTGLMSPFAVGQRVSAGLR